MCLRPIEFTGSAQTYTFGGRVEHPDYKLSTLNSRTHRLLSIMSVGLPVTCTMGYA